MHTRLCSAVVHGIKIVIVVRSDAKIRVSTPFFGRHVFISKTNISIDIPNTLFHPKSNLLNHLELNLTWIQNDFWKFDNNANWKKCQNCPVKFASVFIDNIKTVQAVFDCSFTTPPFPHSPADFAWKVTWYLGGIGLNVRYYLLTHYTMVRMVKFWSNN